ncbi:MAG: hypothetical protein H6509_12420 [Bryobacterales bacterium]|nr:hypothetical protein [Bryobacterales bacterium]
MEPPAGAAPKISTVPDAKIANPALQNLAEAVGAPPRVVIGPPEEKIPLHDPALWSTMFGLWG